ncbi:MAG: hypothetical protein HY319_19690 [Armatimonadetes bacterium]|nr:hypothetical protein [Armatimonadota bacterium]
MAGRRPALSGFTLVEVLVSAMLLSLLLFILGNMLVPAMRQTARVSGRSELQQLGSLASNRMLLDLQRSAPEGITLHSPTPERRLLAIHRLSSVDAGGERTWESELVLYEWKRPVLTRSTSPLPEPATQPAPLRPTLEEVEEFLDNDREQRILARSASELELSVSGASVELWLLLEAPVPGRNQPERLTVRRRAYLWNN